VIDGSPSRRKAGGVVTRITSRDGVRDDLGRNAHQSCWVRASDRDGRDHRVSAVSSGFAVLTVRRRTFVRPLSHALARAALLLASGLAACRSHPKPAVTPTTPSAATREGNIPRGAANGPCGARAAVAVSRASSSTRRLTHAAVPGALVVRLLPADTTMGTPNGPIRLVPTAAVASAAPRVVKIEDRGLAHSGPMPVGRWVVEASGRGFETRRLTVAVRSGAVDTVRFRLPRACPQGADR
jgi:hypothetical protein